MLEKKLFFLFFLSSFLLKPIFGFGFSKSDSTCISDNSVVITGLENIHITEGAVVVVGDKVYHNNQKTAKILVTAATDRKAAKPHPPLTAKKPLKKIAAPEVSCKIKSGNAELFYVFGKSSLCSAVVPLPAIKFLVGVVFLLLLGFCTFWLKLKFSIYKTYFSRSDGNFKLFLRPPPLFILR